MCWYLLVILGIWIIVAFITYRYLAQKKNAFVKEAFYKKLSNVLFVIAHPDDECMFFGPAIMSLIHPPFSDTSSRKKRAKDVFILCLSDGNADGLGKIRREEFKKSCKALGLADSNILIHNGPTLFEDNPSSDWDAKAIGDTLSVYVQKLKIDTIVTFDQFGVSGHLNHKSLYHGVCYLKKSLSKKEPGVRVFILETVNILRKYLGFVDSVFIRPQALICTADWSNRKAIQNAMTAHASQYQLIRQSNSSGKNCEHRAVVNFTLPFYWM